AAAYEADGQLKGVLGPLFEGHKTDYTRVRRLSSWIASSAMSLGGSEFAFTVNPIHLPQEHIAAIKAAAGKLRQAAAQVRAFGELIAQLPGLDPAVRFGRKFDLA